MELDFDNLAEALGSKYKSHKRRCCAAEGKGPPPHALPRSEDAGGPGAEDAGGQAGRLRCIELEAPDELEVDLSATQIGAIDHDWEGCQHRKMQRYFPHQISGDCTEIQNVPGNPGRIRWFFREIS